MYLEPKWLRCSKISYKSPAFLSKRRPCIVVAPPWFTELPARTRTRRLALRLRIPGASNRNFAPRPGAGDLQSSDHGCRAHKQQGWSEPFSIAKAVAACTCNRLPLTTVQPVYGLISLHLKTLNFSQTAVHSVHHRRNSNKCDCCSLGRCKDARIRLTILIKLFFCTNLFSLAFFTLNRCSLSSALSVTK